MTSENAQPHRAQAPGSASENKNPSPRRRPGAAATPLPPALAAVLADYTTALENAPVSAETRRTYSSKVRQYLAWLAVTGELDGDPLSEARARDWAVRDYRTHMITVADRRPATVNNALAAIDDFSTHRGLGPAVAKRLELPEVAPRALDKRATKRWRRAVEACTSPRDRALASIPLYAGARIAEVVRMDVPDVQLSARKGTLWLLGKGERPRTRTVPAVAQLREDLRQWLDERGDWRGAADSPALFLNRRGGRLSVRGASGAIAGIAEAAALDDPASAHTLRHTCATIMVRSGTDLVTVAVLLGHARLETTRTYSKPTEAGHLKALELIPVDR